jgi:hypothetical protein
MDGLAGAAAWARAFFAAACALKGRVATLASRIA